MEIPGLITRVKVDTSGFKTGMREITNEITSVKRQLSEVTKTALGFAAAQVGITGLAGAFSTVKNAVIGMNSMLETSELQFRTLLGSADQARKHVKELFDFAAKTPFETGPIIQASRLLLTFGTQANDVTKALKLTGDAAAISGQSIREVAFWYGRAYSAIQSGRPFGEAAMRLQEMGILTATGRTRLEALQESGASAKVVFAELVKEFERFQGSMELQANTWEGLTSTINDNLSMAAAKGFRPLFEILKATSKAMADFVQTPNFESWASTTSEVVQGVTESFGRLFQVVQPLSLLFESLAPTMSFALTMLAAPLAGLNIILGNILGPLAAISSIFADLGSGRVPNIGKAYNLNLKVIDDYMKVASNLMGYGQQVGHPTGTPVTAGPSQTGTGSPGAFVSDKQVEQKLDEIESGFIRIGNVQRLVKDLANEQKEAMEGLSGALTAPKLTDALDEIEADFKHIADAERELHKELQALPMTMAEVEKMFSDSLDKIESGFIDVGNGVKRLLKDVAAEEASYHEGISPGVLKPHETTVAYEKLNKELETHRRMVRVLGKDYDAVAAEIAATETALRDMVRGGLDETDERVQQLSKHLGELKQAQALKSMFQDVFGSVSSAIEKMATGVIQGTLKMRDAFRNLAQSIIVEFTQKVIRQALNPLISAMAQAAGSAVSSIFPGVFTSGAGGALGLSAGGTAAVLGGLGVAGIAYGGIANNPMIATGGGLASIGYGGYNLYNAARGTTTGMTASGAGIGGSTLGSAASVGAGLGVLGGALAIAGAQSNNRQLMAAGQLASVASTGVGLYGAATGTGMAATGGMMAAAAPAMAYIGAAVLAAMSAYNAVMVSGDNWKKIPEAQRTGTKYGAYLSPINLASFGALGALVPEEYSAYIDPISAYIGGLFGSLFGGSPKQTIQLPGMNYPITTYESGIKTLIKSYEEGIGGANAFSGALGKAESTGMLLSVLNRPWSQRVGQFQIQGRSGAGAQVANIGGSRTLPWARKFNAQDLQDPALIESLRVYAGMLGAPAEQKGLAKFLKEFIPAVVKADKDFRGEIDKIRTLVMPYLTTAETDPFKTGMAGVEDVFSKKGVKAAQEAFSEFQQSQTELWNSIMQRVQSMKDAMTEAFTNAFQANSVAQGVEVFAQTLRAQVVQAVQSGLVEALTSSEAFHGVLLPALQPIREVMARVAGAKPEELTEGFFAERKAEIGTIFTGINERFGKIAPIIEQVLGFGATLGEMIGLRPAGSASTAASTPLGTFTMLAPRRHSGGWIGGNGDESPIIGQRGEYVVRRRVAKRYAPELEYLNQTGEMPSSGPQTVIVKVMVGEREIGEAVIRDINRRYSAGERGRIPIEFSASRKQG